MTKQALTLSIIIPVYNEESHLRNCLQSIADQVVPPDEVIVVDNNSTDSTVEIANAFPFVKVISEKKQGVVFARNKGFNAAKSTIIGRIDADTILPIQWTRTVHDLFKNPRVAGITGPVSYYDMPFEPMGFRLDKSLRWLFNKTQPINWLFGTNMAIRRTAWKAVEKDVCSRSDIHEDLDLAIHLQQKGKEVLYSPQLYAGMSSRRFDDSYPAFYRYLRMHHTSFQSHDIQTNLPNVALVIYLFFYTVTKPIRRSYDHKTDTYSLRHYLYGDNKARKNPMQ